MITKNAPIALFTYNRPSHTQQTVEALLQNELASESDLIIFSDGAKNAQDQTNVNEVRHYLRTISGFSTVSIVERSTNYGLGPSIIKGVTDVVNKFGRIIVLEDDLLTSPYFLRFMNDALELYHDKESVISIHGYVIPTVEDLPTTFFIRGADCWGWATWERGWALFEENGSKLLNELKKQKLTKLFDFDGAYRYTRMLKDQIIGNNSSWAVRWYASAFLQNRLTLYPGSSLIRHIGRDGSGTHACVDNKFEVILSDKAIVIGQSEITEDREARRIIADYLCSIKTPLLKAVWRRGKKFLRGIVLRKRINFTK